MHYAGIGSRKTPKYILVKMGIIAKILGEQGYTLRSGGAIGADMAFEEATRGNHKPTEIFYAIDATDDAIAMAKDFHPAWGACNERTRRLHGRNMMIILGQNLQEPVSLVVCWTPDALMLGGTAQALRLAEDHNIKIYNLADKIDTNALVIFLSKNYAERLKGI